MFLKTHRSDIGMFALRLGLSFVFVAHSATQLMDVFGTGINDVSCVVILATSILELVLSIMLLSGFLISIACYILAIMMVYYLVFSNEQLGFLVLDRNNAYAFLVIMSCIATALIGPGKFVLNRRYGHIASSLREEGVDKEVEIMGT